MAPDSSLLVETRIGGSLNACTICSEDKRNKNVIAK